METKEIKKADPIEEAAIKRAESLGYTEADYEYREIVESIKAVAKQQEERFIEKAVEWIKGICSVCVVQDMRTCTLLNKENLIHQFRIAMKSNIVE